MATEDWIEVAFVFDERPRFEELERLFESMISLPEAKFEVFDIASWDDTSDIHHSSGTAADAANACKEYLDTSIELRFEGFNLKIGSGYSEGMLSNVPHITVRENIHPFTDFADSDDENEIEKRRRSFVSKLAHCAEHLDPRWGFGRRDGVVLPEGVTVDEILSREHPPLYEFNFLDRVVVSTIGREVILNSSAWSIEELENEGIFLTVRKPPNRCTPHVDRCVGVARELGLSLPET